MSREASQGGYEFETVLGVRFLNAHASDAIAFLSAHGGLMVVPSAPVMTMLVTDERCREAVVNSDFAIVDSAYMASLWWLVKRRKLHRVSGLEFLRSFLESGVGRAPGELFLVNPTDEDRERNLALLRSHGFEMSESDCYTAPIYDKRRVDDPVLLRLIENRRPRFVMLNLGGGTQEPLGLYLRTKLSFVPGIMCTGAAIAFLTGRQARISPRADAFGLGWLVRSVSDPRRFVPRYLSSVRLASLVFQYGRDVPPMRT